ncbi:MAG TPA: aminoglycoside phosphotransferase family protein [Phototrophicaceae bacterium]|nr:aminoglycoside phosphotransferase family protein [Phototrophicaceae bacterium]
MIRDDAIEWIHQQVKNVISVEVQQQWELSTVLRVRTTSGDVFFKTGTPLAHSADEPRLLTLLACLYPDDVPDVIAADFEHGWLIISDVGVNLRDHSEYSLWHRALMRLAELQHDSSWHLDALIDAGCPDQRTEHFDMEIDAALANEAMLASLEPDEIVHLRNLAPLLHAHNQALQRASLVHGDVHGGNMGYRDEQLRFIDWSESCIGHPFFDLPVILRDALAYFPLAQVDRLRDDYLACWGEEARLWPLALPVAALHHAIDYNNVAELVAPDQPRVRVARWLRQVIAAANGTLTY